MDNFDSLYPIAYHKLVELKVIHEKRILFLHVTDEYNLAQFVEVANACAKSETALIVAHHQDESLEPKYQMVFPKVIYHSV